MWEHLHPKLVHFPIALVIAAMMLDVLSRIVKKERLYQAARYVFNLAAFFSVFAVISGLIEADRVHLIHPVLTSHRLYALSFAILSCISCILLLFIPARFKRPVFSLTVFVCVILVLLAGNYGGQMVYEYGVGVVQ